jgi:hypothetical protein
MLPNRFTTHEHLCVNSIEAIHIEFCGWRVKFAQMWRLEVAHFPLVIAPGALYHDFVVTPGDHAETLAFMLPPAGVRAAGRPG